MNSEELWETTMDPARRILKQVAIEDAQEADQIFDMLMGTDVPARKSFIQSHARRRSSIFRFQNTPTAKCRSGVSCGLFV